MNRGEYLSKLIEEKNYTVMSLSKESGVPYTTIRSMIERNLNNASIDNVIKICRVLGVSVESLNKPEDFPDIVKENPAKYNDSPKLDLPIFGNIAAGALSTVEGVTKSTVEYMSIPRKILGKHSYCKDLFVMRVNGDSMNKIIPDGSFVIAKQIDCDEVKDDDIVIFSHDGDFSMKRVRIIEEDQVLIFSPDSTNRKFRDIEIPYDTQNDLKIYAKVIWYSVILD
ncbi:S24 family peptidase [Neobacillus sp. WH10]|uniref:XRE family transcriptional regulator n=1 Tax=Neobacillus sp. WH10 TaxID=3047873 RepID=UPI0024C0F6F3|nr:S24 family peptidase [Neobacillus sp. WH10]WHY75733.1 S24 family peptidase [Neobacillus sp. WH10]